MDLFSVAFLVFAAMVLGGVLIGGLATLVSALEVVDERSCR